jgi:hypothetical protein
MTWTMKCLSPEQTQEALDRICDGSTLEAEANRLGVSGSGCLTPALRELVGVDDYKALLKESRANRPARPRTSANPHTNG